uniref:AAA+ ATPase domain-containing protein n=1 Tax=Plectus sambesii TaxID=2011161 RepID=A0A914WXS1_9BILA
MLTPHMAHDGLVARCLQYAEEKLDHIMDFTKLRALGSLFAMINATVRQVQSYNQSHSDFPMANDQMERYVLRSLITNVIWAFSGDGRLKIRQELSEFVRSITTIPLPPQDNVPIIDFEVTLAGEWSPWSAKVPQIEVETHKVAAPDLVVPTLDTVRHEHLLQTWLAEHKPLVLCGPPGSGKTMTLFSALRSTQDMEVVGLNFSSATTPELLLRTFDHYCEYKRTPNGVVLAPIQLGRWLIMFCDEINLPNMDKYGTQRVISFLRQIVEHNGFYRTSDQTWVTLERIQFVGACNPPTDPGRKPLSHRFLRHVPVVYVDYPGETSLKQIYGTFNRAMLRMIPSLRTYAEPLTNAMVEFYLASQDRFTQDQQPHYVYSPRELTRWVRGICEAIRPLESLSVEGLIRLWAHEALRLFQDRLITNEERKWTDDNIDAVAQKHFPTINSDEALKRPILYSCWLTKDYLPVDREELRSYVKARLRVFYEEELDVQLVLFNEVLDHVLRIDRIYRQPQGHLLLIGVSGSGKTTLSRFVAWMNGLSVFQLKVHSKYSAEDFDEDLRSVLRRAGCRNEKICFIMDESNIMDTGFLERLNTLLANGEVPGLFEGDEHTTLMTQIKEGSQREGLMLDSQEELYKWFTAQVIRNLHVVFTMNPSSEGLRDRASTSPALFNRCVLNWFGDWSDSALYNVGKEFTLTLDIEKAKYDAPGGFPYACEDTPQPPNYREAVTNAFVHVHQTLHAANRRQTRRGHRTMAITPRHYLDFINHYVKLFHEKRTELEDEKLHLNVGLNKIRETEDQVKELQKSLSLKSQELEAKNAAANAKLKQMLSDQQRAEKEKQVSEQIQKELHEKMKEIEEKTKTVQEDLAQVEPAVIEAQTAVKGIRKQQLVEVRSMAQPPPGVKLALESICLLLGENVGTDWKGVRSVIVKEDFMPRILGFDTDQITPAILSAMQKYQQNPDWDFEKINRASQACGPMVKWAKAQLLYSDMLHKVEPLRNELIRLEKDASTAKAKGEEVKQTIAKLEESIAAYKEEYAQLIGQAETIKAGLASVQEKVGRSIELLRSLGSERDRWEKSCDGFSAQMETIVGDVLLSAAFLAYAGYFDQQLRQQLFHNWMHHLELAGIQFRSDMARVEYLSNPDERLKWQQNTLPVDDLCTENAIMLHRFNRYPLIIDPSGQATGFLLNEFGGKKITKTSFLDDAFRKNLESALRFGNPLLVQDVESYDPILNPVLNREVKRTGGRVLITLGDQDIDLSPSFQIFLSTRDPTVEFPPDVCSRVTFVNFTVTRGSLQTQCLNQVLKSERPDVDKKRSDLLKLQGEFALRLRQLEKALLQALNDSKGKILDDNSVIATLETLKNEAAEVQRKSAETDVVMAEVERTSQVYTPLSQACSLIYFTLEQLNQIHFLYQYSLQFFLDIFTAVLSENNEHLKGVTDYSQRLSIITTDLFQMTYNRVAQGMMHEDKITYAILLAKIYLKGLSNEPTYDAEFDHMLRGVERLGAQKGHDVGNMPGLTTEQLDGLAKLIHLPAFSQAVDMAKKSPDFAAWIASDNPENNVAKLWQEKTPLSKIGSAVYGLLVVQALRPDRWLASAHIFVSAVFGNDFMLQAQAVLDLNKAVDLEVKANTPVLLCSVPGYDASGRVEDMAAEMNKTVTPIAIGSAEGFTQADSAINSANKSGRWVLLKNVHLAPQWLGQLEKKLHTLNPHPQFRLFLTTEIHPKVSLISWRNVTLTALHTLNPHPQFRLFLTTEIHPKLPVNLLRTGRIFVFEPPPGVKANLLRTFSTISAPRMSKAPAERARLYFMLSWFHAIVQERLRYTPLGWAKQYEFSEADFRVACDTLDACVDATAMGRANLPPEKVPWDAMQTLLSQCIYGGKIDNKFDQILLDCFIRKLFTSKSFDPDCTLITNIDGHGENLQMPDGVRREQFVQW